MKAAALVVTGETMIYLGVQDKLQGEVKTTNTNLDPTFKVEFDADRTHLNFDEAAALTRRFSKVADTLPPVEIPTSEQSAIMILAEYNNYFAYEGFTRESKMPQQIRFVFYPPHRFNNVLGSSDCDEYININARTVNPVSEWYNQEEWLWTVVHESAHIHQTPEVCNDSSIDAELLEATAQIMTAEVMASLANSGDIRAFRSLTTELSSWAMGAALAGAIEEDRMEEYMQLRDDVSPGAMSQSRIDKTMRKYQFDMPRLKYILEAYSAKPLNIMVKAFDGYNYARGLAIPKQYSENFTQLPEKHTPSVKLDDLQYFIANLEPMAEDIVKGK